jgi:tetratricopeptide (TPR) repeat protein
MAINKSKVMEAAQRFVEKGQTDKAIKEYLKIVDEDAKDVRIWLKIGDLYAKKNDKTAATETYLKVAEFYGEQGFYLKAVAVYKQVLKLDPRLIEVNIKLAEVYRQLGLLSDAMQQYELVAAFYHREGKTKEALSTIRELVELDPENVATRIKLAELYSKEQMAAEAIAEFTHAAEYLRSHGRTDDFIKVAERLVWHQTDNHAINRELAGLYLKRNDPRHALTKLQACFKADPRDVETLSLLASAFLALDQKQKTVSVWKELARIHIENNQQAAAMDCYRRILAVMPDDPDANAAAAAASSSTGRHAVGTGNVPSLPVPPPQPPPVFNSGSMAAMRTSAPLDPRVGGASPSSPLPAISAPMAPLSSATGSPVGAPPGPPAPVRLAEPPLHAEPARPRAGSLGASRGPTPVPGVAPPGRATGSSAALAAPLAAPLGPAPRVAAPALGRPAAAMGGRFASGEYDRFELDTSEPEMTSPTRPTSLPIAGASHAVAAALDGDFELSADELSGPGEEVMVDAGLDPAETHAEEIQKILTETEVYTKYNLHQKALDHLERIFELDPRSLEAREKLREIYTALGRVGEATDELQRLVELTATSQPRQADGYLREMMGVDAARARALATRLRLPDPGLRGAAAGSVTSDVTQRDDEFDRDLDDDLDDDLEVVEAAAPEALPVETSDLLAGPSDSGSAALELDVDDFASDVSSRARGVEGTMEIEADQVIAAVPAGAVALDDLGGPGDGSDGSIDGAIVAELAFGDSSAVTHHADPAIDAVLDDVRGFHRPSRLAPGAVADALGDDPTREPAAASVPPGGTSLEDDLDEADFFVSQNLFAEARGILAELLGRYPNHPLVLAKLQDIDAQEQAAAPSPPPVVAPRPAAAAPAPARKPAVIAKALGDEDADTHYDLGLAYREMGLHDEAIKEFLLVKDTPGRSVQCHLMIGLCHAERGKLDDAVIEFKNGLYVDGITDRESLALYFELGAAYEGLRDAKEALYYYEKVQKRDPRFREVDKRIAAVKAMSAAAASSSAAGGRTADDERDDSVDAVLDLVDSGDFPVQ